MSKFDKYQQKAINTINGPVLCAAGPGSGKTTVIVNRTLNMVKNGINPASIIIMTFTSDAAKEMATRYQNLPGAVSGPSFCTIHSFAFMVCRECYGYTGESVIKTSDAMKYVKKFLLAHEYYQDIRDLKRTTANILSDISRYTITKNKKKFTSMSLDKEDFIELYKGYQAWKGKIGKIDFDDMLILCREAILKPDIKAYYQERYQYIMVDEFQDTSEVQADILYALADKYKNIFICGDDDQSIYGFRNAKPDIMLNFPKDYPGCEIIKLSVNYRSDKSIVEAAQTLIKNNKVRIDKDISGNRTEDGSISTLVVTESNEQNKGLAAFIKEHVSDTPYKEMAVLCRTNKEISSVAKVLSDNDIPFVTKEQINNPHDTWLFKTLLAYIKIAYKKADRDDYITAALRPSRYFKKTFLEETDGMVDKMLKKAGFDKFLKSRIFDYKTDIEEVQFIASKYPFKKASVKIAEYISGLSDWIKDTCEFQKVDVEEYRGLYEECLLEMEDFSSIDEYLDFIETNDSKFETNVSSAAEDGEGVTISTMHRAKGREWDIVIVTSVNHGNVPYIKQGVEYTKENEEEERRLFYVAVTRARKLCTICIIEDGENESDFMKEIKTSKNLKITNLDRNKYVPVLSEKEKKEETNIETMEEIVERKKRKVEKGKNKRKIVNGVSTVPKVPHTPTQMVVGLDDSCPL